MLLNTVQISVHCRVYQDPPRARDQEVYSGQQNKNSQTDNFLKMSTGYYST